MRGSLETKERSTVKKVSLGGPIAQWRDEVMGNQHCLPLLTYSKRRERYQVIYRPVTIIIIPLFAKLPWTLRIEMSFTSIPILDLAAARDPATKPQFLQELRHALMEVGFLYLKNVGISDDLFQRVIELGKSFFDIPEEEK